MNLSYRRPVIRIALLLGAWCCGFLFTFALGQSLGETWTGCGLGTWIYTFWQHVADELLVRLEGLHMDKDVFAQIAALTLGHREFLSADMKQLYREAGASHLLALSGMHLGILFGAFSVLGRYLMHTRGKWLYTLGMVVVMWSYALMTGLPMSLVRAALMFSIGLMIRMTERSWNATDMLVCSMCVVFLVDPAAVMDIGFQLSCAAMVGITLLGLPLSDNMREWNPVGRWLGKSLAISFSAQFTTLPLTLFWFRSIATFSALTSLVAVPLTTLIIFSSIGIFCGSDFCVEITTWLLWLQNGMMDLVSRVPGAYIDFKFL